MQGNTRDVMHKFTVDQPKKHNDKVMVAGLILAGSADFKTELGQSDMFDQVCDTDIFFFLSCLVQKKSEIKQRFPL